MNRQEIKDVLTNGVATVSFQKADGTKRDMKCTLKEDLLPAAPVKAEGVVSRPVNESVLAVWDLDNSAWRSFRIDSILDFKAA